MTKLFDFVSQETQDALDHLERLNKAREEPYNSAHATHFVNYGGEDVDGQYGHTTIQGLDRGVVDCFSSKHGDGTGAFLRGFLKENPDAILFWGKPNGSAELMDPENDDHDGYFED